MNQFVWSALADVADRGVVRCGTHGDVIVDRRCASCDAKPHGVDIGPGAVVRVTTRSTRGVVLWSSVGTVVEVMPWGWLVDTRLYGVRPVFASDPWPASAVVGETQTCEVLV